MSTAPSHNIMVILTGATVAAGLVRAAMRNGWPILIGPVELTQALRQFEAGGCGIVFIHIPILSEVGLALVRGLRDSASTTTVIAVGATGSDRDEILARAAGVSLFLSEGADEELIERTVWTLCASRPGGPGRAPAPIRTTKQKVTAG